MYMLQNLMEFQSISSLIADERNGKHHYMICIDVHMMFRKVAQK